MREPGSNSAARSARFHAFALKLRPCDLNFTNTCLSFLISQADNLQISARQMKRSRISEAKRREAEDLIHRCVVDFAKIDFTIDVERLNKIPPAVSFVAACVRNRTRNSF